MRVSSKQPAMKRGCGTSRAGERGQHAPLAAQHVVRHRAAGGAARAAARTRGRRARSAAARSGCRRRSTSPRRSRPRQALLVHPRRQAREVDELRERGVDRHSPPPEPRLRYDRQIRSDLRVSIREHRTAGGSPMAFVDWTMQGSEYGHCNCNVGCPCQFNALPQPRQLPRAQLLPDRPRPLRRRAARRSALGLPRAPGPGRSTWAKAPTSWWSTSAPTRSSAPRSKRSRRAGRPIRARSITQVFSTLVTTWLPTQYKPIELAIDVGRAKATRARARAASRRRRGRSRTR